VHEPAVVLTDVALAILGAVLCWRLTGVGAVILGGLASAALWGAVFHAFFPAKTATVPGFIAWLPVAFSILVVAAMLLDLGLRLLAPRLPQSVRRALVAAYAVAFVAVVLLVDESFGSIVRFYGPTLGLVLVAAGREAIRARSAGWTLIAAGFALSAGAALLQQAGVAIHPVYFDHNAVYHVVQAVALVLLYVGFQRVGGTDPAPRA